MVKVSRPPRTHRREELAAPRPPVLLGILVTGAAVLLFAALTHLLN